MKVDLKNETELEIGDWRWVHKSFHKANGRWGCVFILGEGRQPLILLSEFSQARGIFVRPKWWHFTAIIWNTVIQKKKACYLETWSEIAVSYCFICRAAT
ncbi:hypothetical protein RchiOBHm_Chr4g0410791 [Rosa chinensis]|uniref:Uncharacterized protein n=1 Tax=Rosa chinensis TaxID=74649 RepID=A0A2P6QVF3_ROSCH|nr:hypothetical protein RchiOBHm_Chr4g0410791 [Rosa chinensis]